MVLSPGIWSIKSLQFRHLSNLKSTGRPGVPYKGRNYIEKKKVQKNRFLVSVRTSWYLILYGRMRDLLILLLSSV